MNPLEDRLADAASTLDAAIEAQLSRPPGRSAPPPYWRRRLVAAAAVLVTVGAIPVIARLARDTDDGPGMAGASSPSSTAAVATPVSGVPPTTQAIVIETTVAPRTTTHLDQSLAYGSAGEQVRGVQERLSELGFFVGPIDGQFGNLTKMAVWAFEKLVMQTPRNDATGVVTDEMWQQMQQPMRVDPRRFHAKGQTTENHVEVYLPEQVVVFFQDDKAVLITHVSSGTGEEWREEVTIDVGEYGNENGTEPLVRGEIGVSVTPGGVFDIDRTIEGVRESALGSLWNPAYFNYGIALHGALNVPLEPASHGCIRMPLKVGEIFQQYIGIGDSVFVWDGVKEPEVYASNPDAGYPRGQLPIFNRIDPDYSTTTTSTTVVTTVPATEATAATQPATAPPATQAPATAPPTAPPTPAPTTTTATTTAATTTTIPAG